MPLIRNKLYYSVKKLTGQAIGDFNLVSDGDRIAIGISGGKDSYSLLHMLDTLRRRAPVKYSLVAVNIDAGYPGYRTDVIEEHLKSCGFEYRMVKTDIYRIVEAKRNPGYVILLLLRAAAARMSLHGSSGAWLQQACPRPSSRRLHRNAAFKPVLRGHACGHEPPHACRQRRADGHPALCVC